MVSGRAHGSHADGLSPWELSLQPQELGASVPAWRLQLAEVHAEPGVLLVDGSPDEWKALAALLDEATLHQLLRALQALPAISIAVFRDEPRGPLSRLAAAFDLRALVGPTRGPNPPVNLVGDEPEVGEAVDRWRSGIARSPEATLVGAMLARAARQYTAGAALVQESLGYSLLQQSQAHQRWLATRPSVGEATEETPSVTTVDAGTHIEIVLERSERHNAFSAQMRDELYELLAGLALDDTKPIVLRGAGPSFCSGGDLAEFGLVPNVMGGHLTRIGRSPARLLHELRHRTIVGLHGACAGAGIELAAFSGRIVAADDLAIWLPESRMGLIPGAGGTVSITRRAGSHRLVELLVTGTPIDAMTARSWGLVDEVVPRADLNAALRREARSRDAASGGVWAT